MKASNPLHVVPPVHDEEAPQTRYRRDAPWQLLRWWHLGPLVVVLALFGGSIALGDARPAVLALWWMGYLTIGLGILLGVIAGIVGLLLAMRSGWKTRRGARPRSS